MRISTAQRAAVECNEHVCLVSCPGSGKTRTVVAKILWCLERVRDTSRRVGCITYTNAAVHEIESRLREFGTSSDDLYYEVCTIHSFCLNHILRPFHYLLPEFRDGFDVVAPDDERWRTLAQRLSQDFSLKRRGVDALEQVRREQNGEIIVPDGFSTAAATEFVNTFDRNSWVSFEDMVYHSARLVAAHPYIPRGMASRFAWMLIDEFQDTSFAQIEIFKAIADFARTTFFLVGDPNQSIMSFAGGHPELMSQFADYVGARKDLSLRGNYRCSAPIITHAERLCPLHPPMEAVGEHQDFDVEPEHVHAQTITQGLFEHFLPMVDSLGIPLGEAAVLAPWWTTFLPVAKELRLRNVPVIGPGSRPYKRRRDFAQFAEHACAYLEQQDATISHAAHRAMFLMLLNINGSPDWRVYSYEGKKTLFRLLGQAKTIRRTHEVAAEWLVAAAERFTDVLLEDEFLTPAVSGVLVESAKTMIEDMIRNKADVANFSTSDLGMYAQPAQCLQLITLHSAKGREFDAVAVVDLHDDKVPHFSVTEEEEIAEARRLLYVAVTRARKLLMYFTDASHYRNSPSRFLGSEGLGLIG